MPSREEKERRRQILNSMVEQDKVDFEKSLPVGRELFIKLFDFLDKELGENACDRTLVLTERFLKQNGVQNIVTVRCWPMLKMHFSKTVKNSYLVTSWGSPSDESSGRASLGGEGTRAYKLFQW